MTARLRPAESFLNDSGQEESVMELREVMGRRRSIRFLLPYKPVEPSSPGAAQTRVIELSVGSTALSEAIVTGGVASFEVAVVVTFDIADQLGISSAVLTAKK